MDKEEKLINALIACVEYQSLRLDEHIINSLKRHFRITLRTYMYNIQKEGDN